VEVLPRSGGNHSGAGKSILAGKFSRQGAV
jgi:hypothetical protein